MTEYAGSIYATDRQALAAAWYDYLTAGGCNSREDAVRFAEDGLEANLQEASEDGWQWPGEPDLDDHKIAMADALVSLFDDWSPAENTKATAESLDDRAQALIEREVMANQTGLVEALFDAAIIERDDITNYYRPLPDTTDELLEWWGDEYSDDPPTAEDLDAEDDDDYQELLTEAASEHPDRQPQEIFQWFLVSEWLAEKLADLGEPTLEEYGCYWWGRTCCGQAIFLDGTFQEIIRRMEEATP